MIDRPGMLKQLLLSGDHLFRQISGLWNQGPKVEVYDKANKVKVVIEAPGLTEKNRHQWSMRVLDQNLFLRGRLESEQSIKSDFGQFYSERLSEQFTKIIPLPAPVRRKPASVEYKDGLIIIFLEKDDARVEEEWHTLDFSKK